MDKVIKLTYEVACKLWRRMDLEIQPRSIERVARVLREAEIKVYEINSSGWLLCEPRPLGIREALTGEFRIPKKKVFDYTSEEPGEVLRLLADKGFPVKAIGPAVGWVDTDELLLELQVNL